MGHTVLGGIASVTESGFSLPLYDDVQRTATSATIDTFDFYYHGVKKATLVITYSNANHDDVDRAQRTL